MKKLFYGWWIVIGAVIVFATITPAAVALATKFLIPVTAELGASRAEFTLSNAILQGMGIFLSPIISRLYEKGKFKVLHSAGVVAFAVSLFMYGMAQNIFQFYLISVVLGISFLTSVFIPMTILIARWFVDKRGLATSIAMTGIGIGGFILSPLITLWIEQYGWRVTYMIYGVIILIVVLPITLFVFKEKPEDIGLEAYVEAKPELDGVEPAPAFVLFGFRMDEAARKPFYYLLLIGMVMNGIVNSGALGQYPPAFEEVHSAGFAAVIISIYSIVGIFGKIILGAVNDKFGILVSIFYGCGLIIITNIAALFADITLVAYVLAITFGLGNAIGSVMPPLLTTTFFDNRDFAKAYGVISSALQLGMTSGSLVVAFIYDQTGAYTSAWVLLLLLSLVTMTSWVSAYFNGKKLNQHA